MELLKKRIGEIRTKGEDYGSGFWTCRITADMAEFRLNAPIINNKEKFKHAVIKIGMLLTRLSRMLEKEKIAFHIQTFPLLEDLRIIAVIRINVSVNRGNELNEQQTAAPEKGKISLIEYAIKRANHLKFELLPVKKSDPLIPISDQREWYLLGSNQNNPFIWLNIGYLSEEMQLNTSPESAQTPQIVSGLNLQKISEKPVVNNSPQYIHAYIGF